MSNITIHFGQYDDGSVWAECDDCHGGRRFDNPTEAMLWNHECYPEEATEPAQDARTATEGLPGHPTTETLSGGRNE